MEAVIAALCGLLGVIVTKFVDYRLEKNKEESENSKRLMSIENRISSVEDNIRKEKIDSLRTQLMVMIKDFPTEKTDILRLGQHYFEDLHGNWVLTNIFTEWLIENDVNIPNWLPKKED